MSTNEISKDHETVGYYLDGVDSWYDSDNWGRSYPVVDTELRIVGVCSSENGTPEGYHLDEYWQALLPNGYVYDEARSVDRLVLERG